MKLKSEFRRCLARCAILGAIATITIAAEPTVPPPTPPAVAPIERDAAAIAKLNADGNVDVRVHDPSTIAVCNGEYWIFYTGRGIGSWHSKDLKKWEAGPRVFEQPPAWVAETIPENRGSFWAPDVIHVGDRYLLYYSVSSFGKNTSAIALATNATLDPADPKFKWIDEGVVVRSAPPDKFNTIDPALILDAEGKLWMSFGSFWSGIKLIELDPKTGKRIAPDSPLVAVASKQQIEASFIYRHAGAYYLFVNWGRCCRGLDSTYNIRVGRSEKITGPYLDRDGKDLLSGGGTLVLETDGPFIGPGHAGIIAVDGREWFGCHFYDGTTPRGTSVYAVRPLTWDREDWPVVGKVETAP